MNSRRKVVLIGTVFLALLAFGVWIATGKRQSATMTSGAVVTLEKVTCGKEHRFVYGSLRQQLMSRLPEKWFGRSGASVVTHRTTNDSTVAWLVWKGKPGTLSVNATSNVLNLTWTPSPPGLRVSLLEVKDDQGQEVQVTGSAGGDHGGVGYMLNIASNVHSVDALIAVGRSRFVEFLANFVTFLWSATVSAVADPACRA